MQVGVNGINIKMITPFTKLANRTKLVEVLIQVFRMEYNLGRDRVDKKKKHTHTQH